MGSGIIGGGTVLYRDALPRPPPNFQLLTAAQVGQVNTSGARDSCQAETGETKRALVGACKEVGD